MLFENIQGCTDEFLLLLLVMPQHVWAKPVATDWILVLLLLLLLDHRGKGFVWEQGLFKVLGAVPMQVSQLEWQKVLCGPGISDSPTF